MSVYYLIFIIYISPSIFKELRDMVTHCFVSLIWKCSFLSHMIHELLPRLCV